MEVSSANSSCAIHPWPYGALTFGVFIPSSLVILFLLCLSQVRNRLCRKCCWGQMGLPVPVNFLISPHYRLPYILVFSVLANELFSYFTKFSSLGSSSNNTYVTIIYKTLIVPLFVVCFVGLKFVPLLACVQAPHLLLGHALGLLYSVLWFLDDVQTVLYSGIDQFCIHGNPTALSIALFVLGKLPVALIIFSVVMWYGYHTVKDVSKAINGQRLNLTLPEVDQSYLMIVKRLFKKPPIPVYHGRITSFLLKIKKYFFPYNKYHKLPLPFLCVVAAMTMFLYQLSLPLVILGASTASGFKHLYNILGNGFNLTKEAAGLLEGLFVGVPVAFALSPIVSLLLCSFLLLHMMGSISKLMKSSAERGITESLPAKLSRVPAAWTYLGMQFGYFVCAYAIYLLVTFLLQVILIVIIQGFRFFTTYFVNLILILIIPLLFARSIYFLQFVLCKFVFFENSQGKFISITNVRLFNWFAYVLFLYNGFAGLVSAVIRVALSAVVSLLLLFRLDTVVMARGFERLDFGHTAFLGFIYLHYSYNNAVMHTFIHLLLRASTSRRGHDQEVSPAHGQLQDESITPLLGSNSPTHAHVLEKVNFGRQSSRNRWLVAYTLLRNPSLLPLTASNLARAQREGTNSPLLGEEWPGYRGRLMTGDINNLTSKS